MNMDFEYLNADVIGVIIGRVAKALGGDENETLEKVILSDYFRNNLANLSDQTYWEPTLDVQKISDELYASMGGKGKTKELGLEDMGTFKAIVMEYYRRVVKLTVDEVVERFRKYQVFKFIEDKGFIRVDGCPHNMTCEVSSYIHELRDGTVPS